MEFQIKPVLRQMHELYDLPRGPERFDRYLFMLQGHTKGNMILPIGGYNPMGKVHVKQRIQELISLDAEAILENHLASVNAVVNNLQPDITYHVVINVSDDLGGAWTDRYASGYKHTFDFGAIAKRKFCTPHFWTSDERYTEELIINRTQAAVYRTIHFLQNGKPKTLWDHVQQEVFVAKEIPTAQPAALKYPKTVLEFYEAHKFSDDYNLILNFSYGYKASKQLDYQTFSHSEFTGFQLSRCNQIN